MNNKKAKQIRKEVNKIYFAKRESYAKYMINKLKNFNFPLISKDKVKELPAVRKHYKMAKKVYKTQRVP